jgi:hypothetical protein
MFNVDVKEKQVTEAMHAMQTLEKKSDDKHGLHS